MATSSSAAPPIGNHHTSHQPGNLHHHNHPTNALGNSSSSNNALASLNNQEFLVNLNSYNNDGFGENIGNGTTNLYIIRTPLARWNEECTVLDSHSMHHAILLNKPRIVAALEAYRNDELNEKRERKLREKQEREERERQKRASGEAGGLVATNVAGQTAAAPEVCELVACVLGALFASILLVLENVNLEYLLNKGQHI